MAKLTQKALINEFETMLSEMPFSKITVSALITRCGVSSNTFYYHFRDIYDLLDAWLEVKKTAFLQDCDPTQHWEAHLKDFFATLKAHQKTIRHLFNDLSRDRLERYVFESSKPCFYDYIQSVCTGNAVDERTLQGLADCCCYSFFGLMLEFLWSNMCLDVDAAIDRLHTIFDAMLINVTTPQ